MPINAGYEYGKAESEFNQAGTVQEKLLALRKMLSVAPKHKGAESLLKQIKEKIAKYKELAEKEKKAKKGSGKTLSIKKEGAATICIIGTVNSGKSTLLKKLTNANVLIAPYPFTTKKPEIGVLDYKGIKLQIVEIPAIAEKFEYSELGPSLLAIIRQSDLLIITFKEKSELKLIDKELYGIDIKLVQEVSPGTRISSVPLSKNHISGLVNVRGDVILVLDLAVIFNNSKSEISENSHVIILKTEQKILQLHDISMNLKSSRFGNKPIGILVDNIGDVVRIDLKDIESPPSNVDKKNAIYYESVAKLKDDSDSQMTTDYGKTRVREDMADSGALFMLCKSNEISEDRTLWWEMVTGNNRNEFCPSKI